MWPGKRRGLTVPVCRNCHAILTEGQRAAGVTFAQPPTLLHQLAASLASLAAFFVALGDWLGAVAAALAAHVAALDGAYPDWRTMPTARPFRGIA